MILNPMSSWRSRAIDRSPGFLGLSPDPDGWTRGGGFFSDSTRGDEGDGPPLPAEAAFLKIPASVSALRSVAGLFVGVGAECIDACFLPLYGERLFPGLLDSKQAP